MTTQQTKVKRARQELMALSALIRRPPLDDVQLRMGVALTVADAIDTLFAQPEEPTPSPDLTARMVALVKDMASAPEPCQGPWTREARSILAELEPVNGDEAEIQKLLSDFRALGSSMTKGQRARSLASAALARGRALAEAGK